VTDYQIARIDYRIVVGHAAMKCILKPTMKQAPAYFSPVIRLTATMLFIIAAVSPGMGFWWDKSKQEKKPDSPSPESQPAGNQSVVQPTYLDTLNRGREVSLKAGDFQAAIPGQTDVSQPASKQEAGTGFRIQLFASSQIEMIRTEKKNLELKFTYPLSIVFTAPYYKLLLGDFSRRSEADSVLATVRTAGYPDAWIVPAKTSAPR
jgi:hypothetical protein